MQGEVEVAIVGGGQAGLALSHELGQADTEHVVLERHRIAETWRNRWDSFCLVIPNWTLQLPGGAYQGDDPDGFLERDGIVEYLEEYARSIKAPVQEGVDVRSLSSGDRDGFVLRTTEGDLRARQVVLATGAYQRPYRPPGAAELPESLRAIDADDYTNPGALPQGGVLVVGSGQTGCQIADELRDSGRAVYMACGRAPWGPRRLGGRDAVEWLVQTPFLEHRLSDLPSPKARLGANVQGTGRRGGYDLHYRVLQQMGVELLGHFSGVEDGKAHFADDLHESLAFGDARYRDLRAAIHKSCEARGIDPPEMPDPAPFSADPPREIDLKDLGAVLFASGYRPTYTSWVQFPDAFDEMGFPIQQDGTSTVIPGLHFMGVHFQRKRKSSLLLGVGEDAQILAEHLTT